MSQVRDRTSSWVWATWILVVATVLVLFADDTYWHWFMVPTTAAGVLIGVDVIDWARGKLDPLEPQALVGLFGFHMVYLVPILHLHWEVWPEFVVGASDWRASFGILGLINVVGLLLYRIILARPLRRREPRLTLDPGRFKTATGWAALLGLLTFAVVILRAGGPGAYFSAITNAEDRGLTLGGQGWLLLLAESWPLVIFAGIVVMRREKLRGHVGTVLFLLAVFSVSQFVVGGLRGSRANTVWPILMALGIVNLLVWRVRKRVLVAGAVLVLLFAWLYGFYKAVGTDALKVVTGETSATYLSAETGRSLERLILEDFGRAGIQAVVIDRVTHGTAGPPAVGESYIGDAAFLTPQAIIPNPPRSKVAVGTDLLYGKGSYVAGGSSSRIYGLAGEGVMNWGLWLAPLMFVPFAMFVRYSTRIFRAARDDGSLASALLAPGLAVACILALGSDFDNVLWFLIKQVLPLAAIVWVSRKRPERLTGAKRREAATLERLRQVKA